MKRIEFDYPKRFLGRNGEFKSIAIELSGRTGFDLTLTPITSKNEASRCRIEIPATSIVEFVNTLKEEYANEFKEQEILNRAGQVLIDTEDDEGNEISVQDQIKLIQSAVNEEDTFIDDIEGVLVWEPLAYHYTVEKFKKDIL